MDQREIPRRDQRREERRGQEKKEKWLNSHLFFFSDLCWSCIILYCAAPPIGEREDMEHHRALASDLTTTTMTSDSNNNGIVHYRHHYNRRKKRTTRQQQLASSTATTRPQSISMSPVDTTLNQQQTVMRRPLSWTKKWTKLFSSCSSERPTPTESSQPIITSIEVSSCLFF